MKGPDKNVIGVDFGSDSVRAVIVRVATGEVLSIGVSFYAGWREGKYRHPEQAVFRQHPQDYLDSFTECVRDALGRLSEKERAKVAGIGIDTTGSTPAPVDKEGTPLALLEEFRENENAMFYLWKDHSAYREAEEITEAAEIIAGIWERIRLSGIGRRFCTEAGRIKESAKRHMHGWNTATGWLGF